MFDKNTKFTVVPEYYFLCMDAIHYLLIPIVDNADSIRRFNNNLAEKLSQIPPGSPECIVHNNCS